VFYYRFHPIGKTSAPKETQVPEDEVTVESGESNNEKRNL